MSEQRVEPEWGWRTEFHKECEPLRSKERRETYSSSSLFPVIKLEADGASVVLRHGGCG